MHALGLPFTGFFVGGFAVLIISLIAWHSGFSMKAVLQSTLLVLAVKAAVSPQSPPPAYIAVAFQGLTGALLLGLLPFRAGAFLFGLIAMLESALQKVLILTILYGKALWEALDLLFKGIAKDFHLNTDASFSKWVIIIYSMIYALWGLILGYWMGKLPGQIAGKADWVHRHLPDTADEETPAGNKKKPRTARMLPVLLTMLLIAAVLLLNKNDIGKAGYVVLRTAAVLTLLLFVVNPLFRWLIAKWLQKTRNRQRGSLQEIGALLPELRANLRPAMELSKQHASGLSRFRLFVLSMIVLALYPKEK